MDEGYTGSKYTTLQVKSKGEEKTRDGRMKK